MQKGIILGGAALVLLFGSLGRGRAEQAVTPQDLEFFEKEVRPVLAGRCYVCHSGSSPKANLALDSRAGWQRGGMSGPVLRPGDPENSRLIQAIRHVPGVPAMPPGVLLPTREIAALAQWIKRGAPDPRDGSKPRLSTHSSHWAFQPLKRYALPSVMNKTWDRTPLDRFILARLEAKGLAPNPPADRRTFIRRACYDLLGLPPTFAETQAFVQDKSPNAYEKLIDHLLASPQYGEKWGRHWLDVVHYGDTLGYDKDKRRDHAWPYRDYVISAFNQDKPYSRFIREQIAGDILYPQRPEGIVATGFLAAGPWDFVGHMELREGTVEKDKTRLLDRDDVVATVMSTFDSLTVHCARCHDHKFDPIPQKEYYRLQAVFSGIDRGDRPYPDAQKETRRTELESRIQTLSRNQAEFQARVQAITSPKLTELDAAIQEAKKQIEGLPPPAQGQPSPTNGYHSAIETLPDKTKWVQVDLGRSVTIQEIRLLPARPTDFADTPGFGFPVRFRIELSDSPTFEKPLLVVDETRADFSNPGDAPVRLHVGLPPGQYVRITATRLWKRTNDYVFALGELQVLSGGRNVAAGTKVTALDSIESGRWAARYLVDNFDSRRSLPDLSDPVIAAAESKRDLLTERLSILQNERSAEQEARTNPELAAAMHQSEQVLAEARNALNHLPPLPLVYAVVPHAPRPIHVLARGDVEQPGERAWPGALSCIAGLDSDFGLSGSEVEGQGRARLAEWIASPRNPLTWRSIVNRVWHYHFTSGIVQTPNDFGRNGAMPTHPELLDWLAVWFQESGQSLKKLHRMIMLSAVYRQSSADNPGNARKDGDNHFLWRMNRRRLEAEEVRDSILMASGKLNLKPGGPGYELFHFKDDHSPVYDFIHTDKWNDPASFRRTIYRYTVRSVSDPFLDCLDSADPNAFTPVRNTTITALQALALRNDPFMVQQAEYTAKQVQQAGSSGEAQIRRTYQAILGRDPAAAEIRELTLYARKYGLANACRLLFNTNEFMFLD